MFSISSIWAVTLRHLYMWRRDINLILGGFYWPMLDILIWGFLGSWIAKSQIAQFHNYEAAALLGILLWQVVGRGCNIMTLCLSEEVWSNNLINMFSLPLRLIDWILGIILFYILIMILTSIFCISGIYLFYNLPIWYIVSNFLIFFPPLFFTSIWLGFICLMTVVIFGKRGIELGFVFGWSLLPFSGAYYPIDVLPAWAEKVSSYLPMSYVFQAMRNYVMYQKDPTVYLIKGYILSILYAICSVTLFIYCFNYSRRKGLARLSD